VTTAPELASILEGNNVFRFVYVGTGRYLGDSDVVSVATQTMYGLIDDRTAAPTINRVPADLRANLQEQTLTLDANGNRTVITTNAFDLTGPQLKRGWYIDLPARGERVNTDPPARAGYAGLHIEHPKRSGLRPRWFILPQLPGLSHGRRPDLQCWWLGLRLAG
jgi:type IV pilus assembly protein PilY1